MSTAHSALPVSGSPSPPRIPPLQNGDHLTRAEFERRYRAMPHVKKAELIGGVVYISSPVSFEGHGEPHFDLIGWLFNYRVATPGIRGGDNATLRLALDQEPQPDAFLIVSPSHGGQVRIDDDDYIVGGPELVAEVAASSVSIDLNAKLKGYLRNGVTEYVVWRVFDRAIDWFVLRNDHYELLAPSPSGILQSETMPGLWLDAAAMVNGDVMAVMRTLQAGLETAEHQEFMTRLYQAAQKS